MKKDAIINIAAILTFANKVIMILMQDFIIIFYIILLLKY